MTTPDTAESTADTNPTIKETVLWLAYVTLITGIMFGTYLLGSAIVACRTAGPETQLVGGNCYVLTAPGHWLAADQMKAGEDLARR